MYKVYRIGVKYHPAIKNSSPRFFLSLTSSVVLLRNLTPSGKSLVMLHTPTTKTNWIQNPLQEI